LSWKKENDPNNASLHSMVQDLLFVCYRMAFRPRLTLHNITGGSLIL
jgi:hypothetical protein